jgi:hypothetical protein
MPKKPAITKEPETHVEAASTIHARITEDLSLQESRLKDIDEETRQLQTELGLLAPALQAKQTELAAARHAKQRANNEERRAEKLAMYSIGTSRETSAAKKLSIAQKTSIEAEKVLSALEPATLEAEHNAGKRQSELTKRLQELADEKRSIVELIQQSKEMAAQTHRELGLQKYAEIVKIDNEKHLGPINEMKSQLVKKLMERHNFLEVSKDALEDGEWWDLATKLERELIDPGDDEDEDSFDGYD